MKPMSEAPSLKDEEAIRRFQELHSKLVGTVSQTVAERKKRVADISEWNEYLALKVYLRRRQE